MIRRIILILLGLLNGGWMIFDGMHVLLKGKYFGPPEPGPWSRFISVLGIDPFKIGPVFVILGVFWLIYLSGLVLNQRWSRPMGIIACVITLWYLPTGTLISVFSIVLLLLKKD